MVNARACYLPKISAFLREREFESLRCRSFIVFALLFTLVWLYYYYLYSASIVLDVYPNLQYLDIVMHDESSEL